jgi:ATP-dependent Lhr-like helicase
MTGTHILCGVYARCFNLPVEHPALNGFHPLVRRWFDQRFAAPTEAQALAWPIIQNNQHVLVSAPTGSGKTLTAFLAAIDKLLRGTWEGGQIRVLYLSPLKALGNDIRRNLLIPLAELQDLFSAEATPCSKVNVLSRTGDTPQDERRSMLRHPPEILITTPESLGLLLTGQRSRGLFSGLQAVIIDEIHALAGTKRGTYTMAQVERLTLCAGEFQRIGLSATVHPLERIAGWMGGFHPADSPQGDQPRKVTTVQSTQRRPPAITLHYPTPPEPGPEAKDQFWTNLADELRAIVRRNRSTLIFANSRRSVEKITRLLNEGEDELLAYSHHGSLSRELRLTVEEQMKAGRLRAIVATGSLELGIDIGSIDEVILLGAPTSTAQAIQRIGRADHRVGGQSRAQIYSLHGLDGVEATTLLELIHGAVLEETRPVRAPLDVLAQVLLSMGCQTVWELDRLYAFVRTIAAYHHLARDRFDDVLAMLAGRFASAPLHDLRARATLDPVQNTFTTRKGTEFLLYQSGGTIPDRGYYNLRLADTKALIGELDEEFVWERRLGDQFTLGTQAWRILRITHNDVEVGPADPGRPMIPFWKAEDQNRSTLFSLALLDFLDECQARLDDPTLVEDLAARRALSPEDAQRLLEFLRRQQKSSEGELPGRHQVVIECTRDADTSTDTQQVVIHTFWGGHVNRPLAMALSEVWETRLGAPVEIFASNDHILLLLPDGINPAELFEPISSHTIETLLRTRLQNTALFGSHFRENAARALLLPRGDARRRHPLWLSRLRAKKLLATVSPLADFPIVYETWRQLIEDEFDLPTLKLFLDEMA